MCEGVCGCLGYFLCHSGGATKGESGDGEDRDGRVEHHGRAAPQEAVCGSSQGTVPQPARQAQADRAWAH